MKVAKASGYYGAPNPPNFPGRFGPWKALPRFHWKRLFGANMRRPDRVWGGYEYSHSRNIAKDFLKREFGS